MAEHHQYQQPQHHTTDTIKSYLPEKSPSTPQVLAVVTLFPLGGVLLFLAGITLAGTLIGLTVALPLFVIFSPIIVPAVLTLALAVTGILTSGAFGITALSSVSWIINYMRRMRARLPEHMEHAQRRVQDTVGHVGQKVRDAGQKTQDVARS